MPHVEEISIIGIDLTKRRNAPSEPVAVTKSNLSKLQRGMLEEDNAA